MRRRDLHPDAPVRAPISALRDFGDPDRDEDGEEPLVLTEFLPDPVSLAEVEEEELVLTEAEAVAEPAPLPGPEPEPEPVVESAPEPVARSQNEPTIAELLARLEQALEKKPLPQWLERGDAVTQSKPQPQAGPVAANEETVEPMDARLRSALENLKRFAPAHG
jgi:hypothetical protein